MQGVRRKGCWKALPRRLKPNLKCEWFVVDFALKKIL